MVVSYISAMENPNGMVPWQAGPVDCTARRHRAGTADTAADDPAAQVHANARKWMENSVAWRGIDPAGGAVAPSFGGGDGRRAG